MPYNPRASYWFVGVDTTQVFSSADRGFVPLSDPKYISHLATTGGRTTRIPSIEELVDVLAVSAPDLVPADAASQSRLKDAQANGLDKIILKVIFNHENRIRALELKAPLTQAQFTTAIRALM